jgi:hypothetical protein
MYLLIPLQKFANEGSKAIMDYGSLEMEGTNMVDLDRKIYNLQTTQMF